MVAEIVAEKEMLELMPVITLVALDYMEIKKLQINPIYRNQILKADILVLSRCDLSSDELQVENVFDKLKTDYPGKLHYSKSWEGRIDAKLIAIKKWDKKEGQFEQFFFSGKDIQDSNYVSHIHCFDHEIGIDIQKVMQVLENNDSVVRAKGYLKGKDGWYLLNYTMGSTSIENCDAKAESKLVVISEKRENAQVEFMH